MENFLTERFDRLKQITKKTDLVKTFGLLSVIRINEKLYDELVCNVDRYIRASLCQFNKDKSYDDRDLLHVYAQEIISLPNRTPNGKLAAKEEVAQEFNAVQVSVERIIQDMNIRSFFELIQLPVIVRIQQGVPENAVDDRAYATSKLHSDIWTGEPAGSGTLIIPIMGDLENIGLEFNEPQLDSYERFVKTYDDYKDTENFLGVLKKYDCPLEKQNLYFFDSYCVHKTIKKKQGIRVSIDFRVIYKEKLNSDKKNDIQRLSNYCACDDWFTEERNVFLMPNATVAETFDALRTKTFSKGYDLRKEFKLIKK